MSKGDAGYFGVAGKFSCNVQSVALQNRRRVLWMLINWSGVFPSAVKFMSLILKKRKEHDITNICEILDIAVDGDLLNCFFTWEAWLSRTDQIFLWSARDVSVCQPTFDRANSGKSRSFFARIFRAYKVLTWECSRPIVLRTLNNTWLGFLEYC